MQILTATAALLSIVAFKDAAKIKSWDAWNDHKAKAKITSVLQKERKCVTWAKLNTLDPGLKEVGRLATRTSKEIKSSKWSVGCETMDRDYAEWDSFKELLPMLGVKHARFFSGWAKTEQEKGVYDFTWLDPHIRECAAMGVKPWVCISYGNPVWGSDFRLGMRVKQITDNPEAFDAWIRYTKALVARYKDVVDEWEVWNEPFNQAAEYAEMFYRTAKAIREVQPESKIFCTAIAMKKDMSKSDYAVVLEKLKKENALDLASYFIYHPYSPNPDVAYGDAAVGQYTWQMALPLRKLVKSYSGKFDIMQGEVGCPGQLEFAHAMNSIEWTEYSQAKWDLRRAIGDAVRSIPSSVFTMIDLQYTFMLQSYGLVRSNTLKEFVYRRPKWYAMRNVYSIFDDETLPVSVKTDVPFEMVARADPRDTRVHKLTCAQFSRFGRAMWLYWFSEDRPTNLLEFDKIRIPSMPNGRRLAWVDMITGRIFEIPEGSKTIPMWDSPVLVTDMAGVPFEMNWKKMTGAEVVDALYRPHAGPKSLMKAFPGPHTNETWLTMPAKDFLPCFDLYGQFRWRDWPGKTTCDDDLKKAAAEEAEDLEAHPGAADRDEFGGWKRGPKFEATGRFYVKKVDGKWWFVDPLGYLFWSFGPVRVSASSAMTPMNGDPSTPRRGCAMPDRDCLFSELPPAPDAPDATPLSKFWTTHDDLLYPFFLARGETRIFDFSSANLFRKYGPGYYETFTDVVHRRLKSWGANTIANSSDLKICLADRTPYAERVECQSRPIEGSSGWWWKFRDPFDPSFAEGVTAALKAHGREAHDKWCIGFFIDNEITWGNDRPDRLALWTLQSPADQPAKVACVNFLRGKYADIAALNAAWGSDYADFDAILHGNLLPPEKSRADLTAFSQQIIEEYFKRTRETVKAFDPQLLYLGCRFAGAPKWVVPAAAKYCDVISYNIYRETIDQYDFGNIDAPVLCGEFHFGATDRGPFGTGVRQAANQEVRAAKMKAYVVSALKHPLMVGVHWHQFADQATSGRFDGEYLQVGWTDLCDRPYPIMRAALREVAYPLYETRAK